MRTIESNMTQQDRQLHKKLLAHHTQETHSQASKEVHRDSVIMEGLIQAGQTSMAKMEQKSRHIHSMVKMEVVLPGTGDMVNIAMKIGKKARKMMVDTTTTTRTEEIGTIEKENTTKRLVSNARIISSMATGMTLHILNTNKHDSNMKDSKIRNSDRDMEEILQGKYQHPSCSCTSLVVLSF